MLRTMGFGLVVMMVIAAIFITSAGNDDSIELVGYGKGSGFGGTDYVASYSEDATAEDAIEATIRQFFEAINEQDQASFDRLLLDDAGDYWRLLFERVKPDGWTLNVSDIGEPLILGKRGVVDVKVNLEYDAGFGGTMEPIAVTMQLLERETGWLVADPV